MTSIDWIIVGLVVLMAVVGARQGFISGVLALAGFALGAFLGTRLAPALLSEGNASPYAPLFGLAGAVMVGSILAGGFEAVGSSLRSRIRSPALGAVDGLLGAGLLAVAALGLAWLCGAVALQTPGARELRRDIQRSEILQRLNDALPPTGPLLNALARFDPFPRIDGPEADVPAPRAAIARDPQVAAAAVSVVRILGSACGLGVAGSGWVAGDGLVVTNAHVIAGQDDTVVQFRGSEPDLEATPVAFDVRNDVAVLRVPALRDTPSLSLAAGDSEAGTGAAILGYPRNGPYDVRAGRVGQTRVVVSQDAYGRGPIQRKITSLRGTVISGNSGGPMVDGEGRVTTTIFAASTGGGPKGGYGVPNSVVRETLAGVGSREVSTGPCTG